MKYMHVIVVCLLASLPALAGELRIAPFAADVTPPLGTPLCDALVEPAKEIVDPLSARGIVILTNDKPIVLCALDWVGIDGARDALKAPVQIWPLGDHVPRYPMVGYERMRRLHIGVYVGFGLEYSMTCAALSLGGVFDEFPNLRFCFFEAGASWLPYAMYGADRSFEIEPQCARTATRPGG